MFEAYSVAVRVSLVNNVTSGLMGISAAFGRVHGDAAKLRGELNSIRLMMLTGGAVAGTGFLGLWAVSKTLAPAKEYAHQLAQMNIAGMKQAEIVKSISAAWGLNKAVPTSTATQNLEAIRELRTVFGDTQEAINFLPTAQKIAYVLSNTRGMDGKGEVMGLARALDLRNATTSPKAAEGQANMMLQAIVASGGTLTAKDFASTFKYGRTATLGWTDEFAYRILPSLMQELKSGSGAGAGGGPGNPLMSAYSAVVQGTVPQKALGVWNELGLLDPSKVVRTSTGLTKGLRPGGIRGSDLFIDNPYLWTQTILKPALERAGKDTEKEQRQVLGYLFPNRTAGAVMSTMLFQSRAIERDRKMFGIAQGIGAYDTLMKTDPKAADAALAAQWKNLLTVIGYEILPLVVSGTLRLVDGLRGLIDIMREHPKVTRALVLGFGVLAGAMAFGGTVLLLRGAFAAVGLALRVMGITKLFQIAGGLRALHAAEMTIMGTSGPAGAALAGLGGAIVGFLGTLSLVALPLAAAVGLALWDRKREREILANPSAASGLDRAILQRKLTNEGRVRRFFGMDGGQFQDQADSLGTRRGPPTVSQFVPFAQQGQNPAAFGNVYIDGKRVADIVSGHQARQMGGSRVVAGRHDPRATPAARTGVQNK